MTKLEAKKALKDAHVVVKRALEGGLVDDLFDKRWPQLGWKGCDKWSFADGKRRIDSLLAGTGVTLHIRRYDDASDYQLVAKLYGGQRELRTARRGNAVYEYDAITGKRV